MAKTCKSTDFVSFKMQHPTISSPYNPDCDLPSGNRNLGTKNSDAEGNWDPEEGDQMNLLCWYLCFHQSLLWLGDWPGESMKISEQGDIDGGDAKNCCSLCHSQGLDLSARGFSSPRKRRDMEESWGETPMPCLSVCLLALVVSFHWGCFTQGASCGGFLTRVHLA